MAGQLLSLHGLGLLLLASLSRAFVFDAQSPMQLLGLSQQQIDSRVAWPKDLSKPWAADGSAMVGYASAKLAKSAEQYLRGVPTGCADGSQPATQFRNMKELVENFTQVTGCNALLYGGVTRDLISDRQPNDPDMTFACSVDNIQAYAEFINATIITKIKMKPSTGVVGDECRTTEREQRVLYICGMKFEPPIDPRVLGSSLAGEFTVNGLVFDIGSSTLLDPSGRGLADIRTRRVSPSVNLGGVQSANGKLKLLEQWAATDYNRYQKKVLRFWKLRMTSKCYNASDQLVSEMRSLVETAFRGPCNRTMQETMKKMFVQLPKAQTTPEAKLDRLYAFLAAMQSDLGGVYTRFVLPIANAMDIPDADNIPSKYFCVQGQVERSDNGKPSNLRGR